MLGLIQNIRFDRNKDRSRYSFKTDLENYSTSELLAATGNQSISNKQLSSNWLEIYRKQ